MNLGTDSCRSKSTPSVTAESLIIFVSQVFTMTPERKERLLSVLRKRQDDITVVLENVADPHNISAVMRTCDAVGIQEIYVLNTKIQSHKKWGPKSSSSASKWLTIHQYTDANLCFENLRQKYDLILSTCLDDNPLQCTKLISQKTGAGIWQRTRGRHH